MNAFLLRAALLMMPLLSTALKTHAQFYTNENQELTIGRVDSLFSEVLQEYREIWVHVPEDYDPAERYPVIYLLDAPAHYYTAVGIMKLTAQWDMPKSIVVGITNTDRTRDLTPTHVPFHRGHASETSGGARQFLQFLEEELHPYVEQRYSTEDMTTLVGHSLGGLFVTYVYLHFPQAFDNYLALEPSLWWDDEVLVGEAPGLLSPNVHQNKTLYVAVANSTGLDTVAVRRSKSEATEQLRANLKFHDLLVARRGQLSFSWEYFGEENHGSVYVPGIYNGLRKLFSWYPFPEMWRFNTPGQYSASELTEPYLVHYAELSRRLQREVKPDWQLLNDVGFFMLTGHNSPKKALAFLELNAQYYPDESRTYVALGDYYAQRRKKREAIKYYEMAIEIDGNAEAQEKLTQLK
ncbi:MAG: alpha/beta hydrolase-fold protein [Bacteroidota bacterium]